MKKITKYAYTELLIDYLQEIAIKQKKIVFSFQPEKRLL